MPLNILQIINELKNQYKDDYVIQEGIVLNRDYLIENGVLPEKLRHSTKYYPIYIPGKHPIFSQKNSIKYITDSDINNPNSDLYTTFNYYEIGTLMREDFPVVPGNKVRIFYNKVTDKTYATMYFEVISSVEKSSIVNDDVIISNADYINSFNIEIYRSVATFSGGNAQRGFFTSFTSMFSQVVGKIILLRDDELALNLYAIAGQESSWFSGARGDKGFSYGYFQLNTKVHTLSFVSEYITSALRYLDIEDQSTTKLSDLSLSYNVPEWQHSVGYVGPSEKYPVKRQQDINYDIQLLVWLGYMIKERYIEKLRTIPVYEDIIQYQKAQRFRKSLISDYRNNTKIYYNKFKSEKNKRLNELKIFKNNITSNPTAHNSKDIKYLIEYYS